MLDHVRHIKPINSNFSWPRAGCLALQSKVRLDYGASTKCRDRRHHASASMAASDKSWSPKGLDGTSAVYWDIFMNTFLWCLVLPSWLPQKRVERWPSEQVEQLYRPSTCSNSMGTAVLQEHRRQTFDRGCIVVKHLDHRSSPRGNKKPLTRDTRVIFSQVCAVSLGCRIYRESAAMIVFSDRTLFTCMW